MTTAYVTAKDQIVAYDPGEHTLEDNFRRFHAENPHVYQTLVRLAQDWRAKRPGQQCGIGMLYEVARWELDLRGEGEPVALNNNYRAFYARMMMDREPELEGLFETRRQRASDKTGPAEESREHATLGDNEWQDRARGAEETRNARGGVGGASNGLNEGGNGAPTSSPSPPSLSPQGSPSGGADAGLAAAPAARTVGPSAPPEDAAAGTPKHTPPAAATLFDLPAPREMYG